MKKTELAYMAGVFDGEGCISISRNKKGWTLSCYIKLAGGYIPSLFQFHFGGAVRKVRQKPANPNWHDYYSWQISSNKALGFLQVISSYLRLKKPQAELAIQFQKQLSSRGHKRPIEDNEVALREAQRILMKELKVESYENELGEKVYS